MPVNYTPEREASLADLITRRRIRVVVTDRVDQDWHVSFKNAVEELCTILETFENRFSLSILRRPPSTITRSVNTFPSSP